jgi:hypothetical protein
MFCCRGFENLIGNVGQRGISALVYDTPRGFRFSLQGRAVSKEDELFLTHNPSPTPLPIKGNMSLSANIGLNYCPFCGRDLQALINPSTKKRFEALAEEHKKIDQPLWANS